MHWPVVGLQVPPVWQESVAGGQTTGDPLTQVPARQVSPLVQALLSVHEVPSVTGGFEQVPEAGSQEPAEWQESDATQVLAEPATQVPAWQTSPLVQALLSEQVVPFGADGFEQLPSTVLQTPAMWHWSVAPQVFGEPPVQTPARQLSTVVQALPSLHVVPSGAEGFEQAPVV